MADLIPDLHRGGIEGGAVRQIAAHRRRDPHDRRALNTSLRSATSVRRRADVLVRRASRECTCEVTPGDCDCAPLRGVALGTGSRVHASCDASLPAARQVMSRRFRHAFREFFRLLMRPGRGRAALRAQALADDALSAAVVRSIDTYTAVHDLRRCQRAGRRGRRHAHGKVTMPFKRDDIGQRVGAAERRPQRPQRDRGAAGVDLRRRPPAAHRAGDLRQLRLLALRRHAEPADPHHCRGTAA